MSGRPHAAQTPRVQKQRAPALPAGHEAPGTRPDGGLGLPWPGPQRCCRLGEAPRAALTARTRTAVSRRTRCCPCGRPSPRRADAGAAPARVLTRGLAPRTRSVAGVAPPEAGARSARLLGGPAWGRRPLRGHSRAQRPVRLTQPDGATCSQSAPTRATRCRQLHSSHADREEVTPTCR